MNSLNADLVRNSEVAKKVIRLPHLPQRDVRVLSIFKQRGEN
jgi:hypothetical protein